MRYDKNSDLPDDIKKDLPIHAQDIYRKTFNGAWDQYEETKTVVNVEESRAANADKAAWDAVHERFYVNEFDEWVHREKKELNGRYKRAV